MIHTRFVSQSQQILHGHHRGIRHRSQHCTDQHPINRLILKVEIGARKCVFLGNIFRRAHAVA